MGKKLLYLLLLPTQDYLQLLPEQVLHSDDLENY